MKSPARFSDFGLALVAVLAALCCGLPLLLVALAASGLGAWLLGSGSLIAAAVVLAVAAFLGAIWLRRRAVVTRDAGCCALEARKVGAK